VFEYSDFQLPQIQLFVVNTQFVMYLEECLLSVKTCKIAFEKMKCPHLLAFPFSGMPCVVFSCGT
jgi:hypothetical protein